MKARIPVLALTALLFLGVTTSALAADSFNFLGQATWAVTITEEYPSHPETPGSITMTGAISKLGINYYFFQGTVQIPDDGLFSLSGGGTLINGILYLTLATSQQHTDSVSHSYRDTAVMHVQLSASNLSGTFYEIGHDFDRVSHTFSERFTAGTLSQPTPVLPLNTAVAPVLPLLLQ